MIRVSDTIEQRRRIGMATYLLVAIGAVLLTRLVYLQVFRYSDYSLEATSQQTRKYEIPARRGEVYLRDNNGNLDGLALDQDMDLIYADPKFVPNRSKEASQIAAIVGGSASTYLSDMSGDPDYAVLAHMVPLSTAAKLQALDLPGIGFTENTYTYYPEGSLASQVIGFVNASGAGQYGFEGYMNQELSGTPGRLDAKTDSYGIPIATSDNVDKQPVNGQSYVLTIDPSVQAEAEAELQQQVKSVDAPSGSVVIMNPNNGDIIAMANYPQYDPNNYNKVTNYGVFQNEVTQGAFEPGSGMKVFTMAAGLNQGVVTPNTTYNDLYCDLVDGTKICDAPGDTGGNDKTMTVVLRDSLNTGAQFVLRMLSGDPLAEAADDASAGFSLAGKELLYKYFTQTFLFGRMTGVEQAGEAPGLVHPPANGIANDVNYADMTFGQGMDVTMLQMVAAMASIANGGTIYKPQLISQIINPDGSTQNTQPQVAKRHVLSANTIKNLTAMLEVVVEHGSGWKVAYDNPGYAVAGKTGTAEIPLPNGGGYMQGKTIGSFLGFAPVGNPKFVMMVRIDEPGVPGYAEYTTVPLFSDLCKWLFKYYGIPPTGSQVQ